jgi:leucyl aminopeptidase
MPLSLIDATEASVPLLPIRAAEYETWLAGQPASLRAWLSDTGFAAKDGQTALLSGDDGTLARVLVGVGEEISPWTFGALPYELPARAYRLEDDGAGIANAAALGWALGAYRFTRYKSAERAPAELVWPAAADRRLITAQAEATHLARDLINTPADHMGPPELSTAAEALAGRFGATFRTIVGEDLLAENFPAIHAVGRAAAKAPRLIDFTWGRADAPKVTLVGKGVCFDTGGLNIKTGGYMNLMKKDMGGSAHVLAIASMIMAMELPVRLRVLIPAVENNISGNSYRPGDIVATRKGLAIEIGNTDAEGRVVLADALALACEESPEMIVDFATLTGAARVALGTELPAFFCNDDAMAAEVLAAAERTGDPLWRMPLWQPYRKLIESKIGDINNSASAPYGGAITAALFLESFVGDGIAWGHIDVMAWNTATKPGRPEGGEAMGARAIFDAISERFTR